MITGRPGARSRAPSRGPLRFGMLARALGVGLAIAHDPSYVAARRSIPDNRRFKPHDGRDARGGSAPSAASHGGSDSSVTQSTAPACWQIRGNRPSNAKESPRGRFGAGAGLQAQSAGQELQLSFALQTPFPHRPRRSGSRLFSGSSTGSVVQAISPRSNHAAPTPSLRIWSGARGVVDVSIFRGLLSSNRVMGIPPMGRISRGRASGGRGGCSPVFRHDRAPGPHSSRENTGPPRGSCRCDQEDPPHERPAGRR